MCATKHIVAAKYYSKDADCDDSKSVEGRFAFISCPVDEASLEVFTPRQFGIPGLNNTFSIRAAAANQVVQMYQCVENKDSPKTLIKTEEKGKKADDWLSALRGYKDLHASVPEETGDKYTYKMQWSDVWYDSRTFKREPGVISRKLGISTRTRCNGRTSGTTRGRSSANR